MFLTSRALPFASLRRALHTSAVARVPILLSPADYQKLPKEGTVALDVSWHMPTAPRNADEEFGEGPRIPGAQRWDLDKIAELRPEVNPYDLTHMMPTREAFTKAAEEHGITNDTHVIFYDTLGVFSSARGAFTFDTFGHKKVSVLDGGLLRWLAEGGAVEAGNPQVPEQSRYAGAQADASRVWSYEQIVENAGKADLTPNAAAIVLDARNPFRYAGTEPEPRPGLESGHIPHSHSLPFAKLLHEATEEVPYSYFRSPQELRTILVQALGGEDAWAALQRGDRQAVFTCGSGMTAAVLWLASKIVAEAEGSQLIKSALYDESWTGYASRKESKIVKGPEP